MSEESFSVAQDKLAESEFFLDKMTSVGMNVFEMRCYFSAFVSAMRSITFALQAEMNDIPGFADWYASKQETLSRDPLARFFVDRRNETLHIGETRINAGEMYRDEDGCLVVRYYFAKLGPTDPFEPIATDAVTAAREYLNSLKALVKDCLKQFASEVDPDAFFTTQNLKARNLSIEDVEEMLGFPRGWTSEIPNEERLRLLKNSTSPTMVEWILKQHIRF